MGCCCTKGDEGETEPLRPGNSRPTQQNRTEDVTRSTTLTFERLEVQEFDTVFSDFARALNPFVTNREKIEQALARFKTAVVSFQAVEPCKTFHEYVVTLKTKLKEEEIIIKIKKGAVEVYGVAGRSIKAVDDSISAIKTILVVAEAIKDMPENVTTACQSSTQDAESSLENIDHIINREFSGVCDICKVVRFRKNLKLNMKKLKNAPNMVRDFCQEVKMIAKEISDVFDGTNDDDDDDDDDDTSDKYDAARSKPDTTKGSNKKKGKEDMEEEDSDSKTALSNTDKEKGVKSQPETTKGSEKVKGKEGKDEDVSKTAASNTEKEKSKDNDKKPQEKGEKKKKKEEYHKQLKMETVGLPDIDKIFTDLTTSLNKFITTREKMQQARESFEKIMKTICNFDGEKELKAYFKELKDKAMEGKIQIYIDTSNGEIKLDSVKGVDPPAPYRNAVKAMNDIRESAKETMDLEPVVQDEFESCAKDVMEIEPLKDFKKLVSGVKEVMALPKKVKTFNENRKKVQQGPEIVKELCSYVKQIFEDIVNVFKEEDSTKDDCKEKEKEGETAEKEEMNAEDDKKEKAVDSGEN